MYSLEIRGEKVEGNSTLIQPLFIISDMISPSVSFRSNDIHQVYTMLQSALDQAGHLSHFRLLPRKEEQLEASQCRGLDGYSFFGLNHSYVVSIIESQENSIYHAIPPSGFVKYNYHLCQPKSDIISRVNNERVSYECIDKR